MEEDRVVTGLSSSTLCTEATSSLFDDIITEDAIVSSILSSLPLKEAVRTSVLSPRWRHLWICRRKLFFGVKSMFDAHTLDLIFGGPTPITNQELVRLVRERRDWFIEFVNSLLRQLKGHANIDEFEVRYFLQRRHSHHLDEWVRFAVESKTRVLTVRVHKPLCLQFVKNPYHFPCHLIESSSVEKLTLECCSLKPPCNFGGLSHLKILILYCIDVTGDDMTRLLSVCCTLEHLHLVGCPWLVTLTIPHHLSRLRELVVKNCDLMREISINAKYLTSLFYWGFPLNFTFGQCSQLTYAYILFKTVAKEPGLEFYLNKLTTITHLQSLTFRIAGMSKVPDSTRGGVNPFLQLKRLDLCWSISVKMSIPHLATLLGASPCLEELTLVLSVASSREPNESLRKEPKESIKRLRETLPIHTHTRLRTVQIDDFYYEIWHIGIALYLLRNATELESMKIRPDGRGLDETQKAVLTKEVPAKVKLTIS